MEAKLLSYKRLGLWHRSKRIKPHHYEGPQCGIDLHYDDRPYMRNGIKIARNYKDGIGFQERYAVYHLR